MAIKFNFVNVGTAHNSHFASTSTVDCPVRRGTSWCAGTSCRPPPRPHLNTTVRPGPAPRLPSHSISTSTAVLSLSPGCTYPAVSCVLFFLPLWLFPSFLSQNAVRAPQSIITILPCQNTWQKEDLLGICYFGTALIWVGTVCRRLTDPTPRRNQTDDAATENNKIPFAVLSAAVNFRKQQVSTLGQRERRTQEECFHNDSKTSIF